MSREDPSTIVGPSAGGQDDIGDLRAVVPALTIVWHHDPRRIGEVAPLGRSKSIEISRKTPPFDAAADIHLSRASFLAIDTRPGGVELRAGNSPTSVQVQGTPLTQPLAISDEQLRSGIVMTLADAVVVCLHAIRIPILRGPPFGLVGGGDAIESVRRQIAKVADLDVPVLIRGETGTGKELVAKAISSGSTRTAAPFVAVNMAAVPPATAADELFGHEKGAFTGAVEARPGYFAETDGGTLFLDEIGATPTDVQKMLLRVLETSEIRPLGGRRGRKVDVRVLAATDEDLETAAHAGRFAEPLLHRLAGYQIRLPPLTVRSSPRVTRSQQSSRYSLR